MTSERTPDRCLSCAEPVIPGANFCEACGARLAPAGDDARARSELDLGFVAGITDLGRVHDRNEDAMFVSACGKDAVAVVCDGVSSSPAPHRASQLAADTVGRSIVEALQRRARKLPEEWDTGAIVSSAITGAQRAVANIGEARTKGSDAPASTVVCALWDGSAITVGWVGDSRAYWIAGDTSVCLTIDDSWARSQLDAGVTAQLVQADPRAHVVTRWLGRDAPDAPPGVASYVPREPGRVVVCSDGFWQYVPSVPRLTDLVQESGDDATSIDLARALVRMALRSGGGDNVTVAVITIGAPDASADVRTTEPCPRGSDRAL
jgi:serine/threonine protein phosphatase PrpC